MDEDGRRVSPKRYRGLERTQLAGYLVATAYNLVRMARLAAITTAA
jgi:IS5 family transposase